MAILKKVDKPEMTWDEARAELEALLQEGLDDIKAGRTNTWPEILEELSREYRVL